MLFYEFIYLYQLYGSGSSCTGYATIAMVLIAREDQSEHVQFSNPKIEKV